jgi:hypothetical protein
MTEQELLEQLQATIKTRIDLKVEFCRMFSEALSELPNLNMSDTITYLAGYPITHNGTKYQLASPVISTEMFCAMYSLYVND